MGQRTYYSVQRRARERIGLASGVSQPRLCKYGEWQIIFESRSRALQPIRNVAPELEALEVFCGNRTGQFVVREAPWALAELREREFVLDCEGGG